MELKELKKAWQKVSSESTLEQTFDKSKIDMLINMRGKGIISRLDRNVKTGLWLLGIFILLAFIDQLLPLHYLLPEKFAEPLKVPLWITILGWIVNLMLVITFLIFVNRYRKIRVQSMI